MLVRAARRKAHPDTIRRIVSYDQSCLPRLPSSYSTSRRPQCRSITADARPQPVESRRRRNSSESTNVPPRRSMATAVGVDYRPDDKASSAPPGRSLSSMAEAYRPVDDIPFENYNPSESRNKYDDMSLLSSLRPFEYSTPLMLGGSLATAPRRYRNGPSGVGGEATEILSVLEACLHVGRIERAGVILQRIQKLGTLVDEEGMAELHNKYLRAAVEQIMMKPSLATTQLLHTWFELEIRRKAIPFNADTVAYMLKASLQSPDIAQRDRLVKRYMDMVQGQNGLEVLGLDILNAKELNQITHICPTYNLAEELDEYEEYQDDTNVFEASDQSLTGPDAPIPAVRPMPQKGLGLIALRKTLSIFSAADTMNMENLTYDEKRAIQGKLEQDAVSSAIERWREENSNLTKMGLNTALQTKSLGARMWRWQEALQRALKVELEKVDEAELKEKKDHKDMERCLYGPFLRLIPTDKLAAVTILSVMTAFGTVGADKGLPLSSAIMTLSGNVEEEALFEVVQKDGKINFWGKSKKKGAKNGLTPEILKKALRFRGAASTQAENETVVSALSENQWPSGMKAKVGAFLMSALIETAKIPVTKEHPDTKEVITQMQPAFQHAHHYRLGRKIGIVSSNPVLVNQMKREPVHSLLAKHLPMLVEPDPWTHFNKGGFISHPAKVMRIKLGDKDQRHYADAAIGKGDMEQTFRGLDVLGKTSWRINQPVFDVMLEAWNSGEPIANLAPENPKLSIPPEPEPSKDPLERRRWIREVKLLENTKAGLHSQRCFQNFQLEIARALRNEVFYFPHNVDFRGRAYPIPPYLNHMGADHCRGLMTFGKGKELGESGLRWLKIHLANVFGFDKASLKEREDFTTKNLPSIYDSATNPLTGDRWWLKAEDPWQVLAACFELKNALGSPQPTKFVSRLPVHQDGTCNGLQHYAALGGDSWGAKQVNLEPGDRPADVYSAVANIVKESIAKDAEKGVPEAQILKDKITRKTVKQTVMTNVYGVTFVGARNQVRKQLVAAHDDLPNTPTMNAGVLSSYIARKIFTGLSSMFRGAHDIQYWLAECAGRISMCLTPEQLDRLESELPQGSKTKANPMTVENSDHFKSSVIWTNPLHMPVVQPYRVAKSKMVRTNMQNLHLSEPHRSDPISKRKQLQAFPPNFIHSLDATHMILSALQCDEMGMTFAAVHDSFWTHASDIDAMNGVLRDSFVRIHSDDIMGRLAAEFAARYKGCMYLAKVRPGTTVFQKIAALRRSDKSTKMSKTRELLVERKRLRLLASSDPKEVEEGKQMVTPGSLWAEFAGESDLALDEDVKHVGIGDMPARTARSQADEDFDAESRDVDDTIDPVAGNSSLEAAVAVDSDELTSVNGETEVEPKENHSPFEKSILRLNKNYYKWASWVWLPLTFPPVPTKGDFDVTRLKNSDYFFS